MIYSKTCEYAIRALAYLALQRGKRYTMIPEISREAKVPKSYLAKIFQRLVQEGILKSLRGPTGGFAFKKDPQRITLKQVMNAIDDSTIMDECVMGFDQCDSEGACSLHFAWISAKEKILKQMTKCHIADMMYEIKGSNYRNMSRSRLNKALALHSIGI